MPTPTEIQAAILSVVYDRWYKAPFGTFDGSFLVRKVRYNLDVDLDDESILQIVQDMDEKNLVEHTSSVGSFGLISLRLDGLEAYDEYRSTFLENDNYIELLGFLVEHDQANPGAHIKLRKIRDNIDLSDKEIDRNIWYLREKGYAELLQALGSSWFSVRVTATGRQFYDRYTTSVTEETSSQTGTLTDSDYDVFISHASEDKKSVARPLAEKLTERGAEVWYTPRPD